MVFAEVFIGVTIAAVVVVEGYLLKKLCAGESMPLYYYGLVFPSRGDALTVLSFRKKTKNGEEKEQTEKKKN